NRRTSPSVSSFAAHPFRAGDSPDGLICQFCGLAVKSWTASQPYFWAASSALWSPPAMDMCAPNSGMEVPPPTTTFGENRRAGPLPQKAAPPPPEKSVSVAGGLVGRGGLGGPSACQNSPPSVAGCSFAASPCPTRPCAAENECPPSSLGVWGS